MPKWEYEERQARLRFPLLVSPILNFLHSHDDCSSIARCCWRISPRLIVLTVYGLVPFISSFHDLRLVLESGDFVNGETRRRRNLLVGKIHGL